MPHKLNHLLFTFAFWLMALTGFAQTFPVTISTQINQPSPIYWSNYADATTSNSPIKIQIVLNDLTISNRQVRIKCYWQGNGISFMNNDFVVGAQPLFLEGGVPLQLTNVNLAPYFEFQNIVGITPNQYAQAMPEGIYTFSVEVYDVATGQKLSRKSNVTAVIFQNEPPLLNLPLNKASIMQQNIQNIVFSWTPRQINVSNVEYQFDLVEIWDQYTPVQNAFAYSPPIYTTTTRATTLQYGVAEPQLIPGKRYAWRIKAKALVGAEEIGVFKNNGYSEIFAFSYDVYCTPPVQIATDGVSQDQAKVTWSGALDNFDYQVNYREKNADSQWYTAVTPREFVTLANLKPNTTYEYTVGAACEKGKYVHSSLQEFTTLAKDEIAFAGCGIKPDPKDLANQNPLPNLLPNDVVTAGDFPIVVIKSSGSNGRFTGEGYVTLPFLEKFRALIDAADALGGEKVNIGQFSRIRITFDNIGVNTDFKLVSGEIIASYDPNWKGMGDLDGVVKDVFGDAGEVINHDIQFEIATVVKNPDGTITVTGTNGASFVQEKTPNDIIFTDKNGKQYTVAANAPAGPIASSGQVAPGGIPTPKNTNGMGSGGVVAEISSPDVSVVFSKGDGKYAFDTAPTTQNGKLNKTYASLPQKSGGTYNVPFKAISNSPYEKDVIVATVDFKNGKTKKDLVFKTQNGTAIDSTQITWNGNVATLTLRKTLDFAKETVIATVRPAASKDPKEAAGKYDIAGTFDLWHLSNKKVNVTLVSVNGATLPNNAEKQLNEIYEPAGVSFVVNTTNISLDNIWGESIQTSESGLLATYTNEQQQITTNLQQKLGAAYKKDTYYIIYTDTPSDKSNILGFMPLKRQYGFIFNKNNTIRTLAHELGHGVFGLEHPFTEYNTTTTTDLLMDYDTGLALNHNDWQVIHAPGLQLYPFIQGDSDGELSRGFALAPDWSFVSNGDETTVKASGDTDTKGFLRGITTKEGTYIWKLKDGKYNYLHETTNKIYENPKVSPNANSTIWLFFENQNSRGKYIRTKYSVVEAIIKSKNETNLSKFIEKNRAKDLHTKGKDENRTTYWGYVGCSNCDSDGVENGNGSGGLVVDKTAKIPADELKQLIAQVSTSNQVNGINAKIFITAKDDTKGIAEVEKAIADLEKSNSREIYIWAKNYVANANFDLELAYGKGLSSKEKLDFDNFEATIQKINNQKELWLACLKFEGTYTYFNPLTAMLDGLAGLIGKAAIPAKYYNPDEPDYNPLPAKIYAYASGKIISEANSTDKYRASRQEFALVCGTWNGLVGTVEAIPAGVSMLMKLQGSAIDVIINHDGARDKLIKTLSNINKEQIDQILSTIGDEIEKGYKKYTKNPCMVSYASGQAVFVVASLFIGAGEANAAKTFLQTLEKLDVAGQLMGKVITKAGKLVKCVLVKTGNVTKFVFKVGKAFFEPGLKLVKFGGETYCTLIPIPVDLSDNMAKAIEEAKKLLKDNKTRFEEALTPLKDENNAFLKDQDGNMLAEIEIDGQKITVLVNKDGTVLKNTAEEILQGTEKELLDAVTLASRLESPTFVVLKNEVNALGTLKPKFLEDFANASDDVLKELDDIVRFEDDYTAFKTLWKNSKAQDIKNNSTDIAKFKAWWYPLKIKVVDELFTNQKAFEGTLNNRFTNIEKIPSSVRGEAWNYYKQQKWDKLESLFREYKINLQKVEIDGKTIEIIWPPANGGFNKFVESISGKYDRYGAILKIENGVPILTGNFTSPILNNNKYSFSQRALNLLEDKYDLYYEIEVLKPLPFKAETTTIIPWFKELGGVGGGKQTMWLIDKASDGYSKTMTKLSEEGYIKITIKSSPNGKYPKLVNKTIIDGKLSGDHEIFNKLNDIGNDVNKLNSWINQKDIPESLLNKLETLSSSELKSLSLDIEQTASLQNLLKTSPENGLEAWKIYRKNLPKDILCK